MARRRRRPGLDGGPGPDVQPPRGGGGGGGGGGRRGGKNKGKPEAFKRAKRDIMLSLRPVRRDIRRTRRQGVRDYRQASEKVGNIYEGLTNRLGDIADQFTPQAEAIGAGLQSQFGNLAGTIGSTVPGVPTGEISAGAGLLGALGGGALAQLSSDQLRNAAYQGGVQAQGATEGAFAQRNMLQDLMDFKQGLREDQRGLMSDVPSLIRQRMDEIRDQTFERGLAQQQLELQRLGMNRDYSLANRSLAQDAAARRAEQSFWADYAALMGGR